MVEELVFRACIASYGNINQIVFLRSGFSFRCHLENCIEVYKIALRFG